MKRILSLITYFAIQGYLSAGDQVFTYGAAPAFHIKDNSDLIVTFNTRKNGDIYTVASFRFNETSKWKPLLLPLIEAGDLEYTYFEITTSSEIPKPKSIPFFGLDIITDEVLRDVQKYSQRIDKGETKDSRNLSGEVIRSMKIISQNEFLQVNPKIVPEPKQK